MKGKLLLITIILLSIFLFLSGCIFPETPTDEVIILNDKNPVFTVVAKTDREEVTWTIGDKVRIDQRGKDEKVTYTLNYKDFKTGEYSLELNDTDETVTWRVTVYNEQQQDVSSQSGSITRGYDHNTPWEERHKIAKQRLGKV